LQGCKFRYAAYFALSQRLTLIASDAGDEREVIVGVPSFITMREPIADAAMLDGFRVGDGPGRQRRLEIAFDFAEVSKIAPDAKLFRLCASAKDHVHSFWFRALDGGDEFGIEAELDQGAGFG
jgi:hypothetical protein